MKNTKEKTAPAPDSSGNEQRVRLAWSARIGIFAVSCILTSLLLVAERDDALREKTYTVGEPSPRTVFSPFDLTYVNEPATQLLREKQSQNVSPVLNADAAAVTDAKTAVREFLKSFQEKETTSAEIPEESPFIISERTVSWLRAESDLTGLETEVGELLEKHLGRGVVSEKLQMEFLEAGIRTATVVRPDTKEETTANLREIPNLLDVQAALDRDLKDKYSKDRNRRRVVFEILNSVVRSNLILDKDETEKRRKKAAEAVMPVEESLQEGELIVQRGMLITDKAKLRLEALQKKMAKKKVLSRFLAVVLLVFLTYLLGFIYLLVFERKTLYSFRTLLLIHTVLLLTLAACKLIMLWPDASLYLMPVALASLLLALLAGFRQGMMGAVAMMLLMAPLSGNNVELMTAALLTSVTAVFTSVRLRKRIQFLKVGAAIGCTYFLVIFAFQIFQDAALEEAFFFSLHGLANGLLIVTPLAFLLLPLFESLFNITTDITLLELSDLNHPLLKRMIVEAPGTYHHSLVVSTLAESACEAIGANALLARVGCYFHDIGKIAHSEYFTENMPSQTASRHEKLTPTMSCLIIMNHVKDGIELGKRYKLKERILRFIPEHQGKGVIYYFYKKAMDQAKPGEQINVEDFRYPGPKPQSRETAVAMLADSTEAASRSLKEPTAPLIRQLVRKIINDKFIDGQMDECDLTLKDLHQIQESFVHNLMAIFHTRVSYPAQQQKADAPDLFKEGQFQKYRTDS